MLVKIFVIGLLANAYCQEMGNIFVSVKVTDSVISSAVRNSSNEVTSPGDGLAFKNGIADNNNSSHYSAFKTSSKNHVHVRRAIGGFKTFFRNPFRSRGKYVVNKPFSRGSSWSRRWRIRPWSSSRSSSSYGRSSKLLIPYSSASITGRYTNADFAPDRTIRRSTSRISLNSSPKNYNFAPRTTSYQNLASGVKNVGPNHYHDPAHEAMPNNFYLLATETGTNLHSGIAYNPSMIDQIANGIWASSHLVHGLRNNQPAYGQALQGSYTPYAPGNTNLNPSMTTNNQNNGCQAVAKQPQPNASPEKLENKTLINKCQHNRNQTSVESSQLSSCPTNQSQGGLLPTSNQTYGSQAYEWYSQPSYNPGYQYQNAAPLYYNPSYQNGASAGYLQSSYNLGYQYQNVAPSYYNPGYQNGVSVVYPQSAYDPRYQYQNTAPVNYDPGYQNGASAEYPQSTYDSRYQYQNTAPVNYDPGYQNGTSAGYPQSTYDPRYQYQNTAPINYDLGYQKRASPRYSQSAYDPRYQYQNTAPFNYDLSYQNTASAEYLQPS